MDIKFHTMWCDQIDNEYVGPDAAQIHRDNAARVSLWSYQYSNLATD